MNIDLRLGDCLEVLKTIPDNSVDSVVTDPPYEIGFMGKNWDDSGIANNIELWQQVLRVLKPGGHLLAFSHSRTYHRMGVAIEDAGFEIRDQIMWIYGSGFPKSHNIGKAIDKIEGNERKDLGYNLITPRQREKGSNRVEWKTALERPIDNEVYGKDQRTLLERMKITKGNSDWEGWGTALKPAHEPIVMARKPLSEKSIAENVLKHGTGGINIDGSRIDVSESEKVKTEGHIRKGNVIGDERTSVAAGQFGDGAFVAGTDLTNGRFPANIIFDEEAGQLLDEQTGELKPAISRTSTKPKNPTSYSRGGNANPNQLYQDKGGASRFFYCPKTSKKDRNEGLVVENYKLKNGVDIDVIEKIKSYI